MSRPVVNRACPTCGGEADRDRVSAPRVAETRSEEELARDWRGLFKERCFFSYGRCAQCRQLFAPVYFSPEALSRLYESMGDNVHMGDEALAYATQTDYARIVAPRAARAVRYLELGPDIGLFTRAIRSELEIEQAYLIEPNRAVWSRLKAAAGPSAVLATSLDEMGDALEEGSLDLAVGIHVLDHLLAPQNLLRRLHRKLSDGGLACLVVHNERSLMARVLRARWPAYCLQHPQLYNELTLASALRSAGFELLDMVPTSNRFTVGYLAEHGVFALTGRRVSATRLSWPVSIRLGNIMAIAAKRQETRGAS